MKKGHFQAPLLQLHSWGSASHWSAFPGRSHGPKFAVSPFLPLLPLPRYFLLLLLYFLLHRSAPVFHSAVAPGSSPPGVSLQWCWGGSWEIRGRPAACSCRTALMETDAEEQKYSDMGGGVNNFTKKQRQRKRMCWRKRTENKQDQHVLARGITAN